MWQVTCVTDAADSTDSTLLQVLTFAAYSPLSTNSHPLRTLHLALLQIRTTRG